MKHSKLKNKILSRLNELKIKFYLYNSNLVRLLKNFYFVSEKRKNKSYKVLIIGLDSDIGIEYAKLLFKKGIICDGTTKNMNKKLSKKFKFIRKVYYLDYKFEKSVQEFLIKLKDDYDQIFISTGFLENKSDGIINQSFDSFKGNNYKELISMASESYLINAISPFLVINLIVKKIKKLNKRKCFDMVFLTSSIGSTKMDIFSGMYFYRSSKSALHLLMASIYMKINSNEDINKYSIFSRPKYGILLLGPGSVKTKMNNYIGKISAEKSAKYIYKVIFQNRLNGLFLFLSHKSKNLPL